MTSPPLYGSHLSVAGGMHHAVEEASRLGLASLQVFTSNQRQWTARPLSKDAIGSWRGALARVGWESAAHRVVSHNSYLVNLASPDHAARRKSIASQRGELERCEALGIGRCVLHPGAHLGTARKPSDPNRLREKPSADEMAGLRRIAKALDELHRSLRGYRVVSCLETTTGSGTNLGYDFHHLELIASMVAEPERVGVCVDSCHIVAAGYDLSTPSRARATLDELDARIGLGRVRVVHLNDSIYAMGSRKDRHAHIGAGLCGNACFAAILTRRELQAIPMILETPKDGLCQGESWDVVNVRRLEAIRRARAPRVAFARRGLLGRAVLTALASVPLLASGCALFASKARESSAAESATAKGPSSPTPTEEATLLRAAALESKGDLEGALALFHEILASNPRLPEAYIGLGDVRFAQRRFAEAEPSYRTAARLDPSDFGAQYGHGRTLQVLGRSAEAIGAYQRALAAQPRNAALNLNMATAYLSLGDARAAAIFAERSVEIDPRNGPARVNLGVAYERLGRPKDAIAQYQAALELMPASPQLLTNLVNAFVSDHRCTEAVNTAIALTRMVAAPEAFERLGWAQFRAGQYDSSSAAYRQAVALDPAYWPAWNGVGVNALNKWLASEKRDSGAASEARSAFRASMRANPDQPKVLKLCTTYGI